MSLFVQPVAVVEPSEPANTQHPTRPPPCVDGVSVVPALSPVGSFIVSRVRHDGTSYARVTFTRAELEQLVCAASEALK